MRLVILDRDGVINEDSDEYIKSPEEWHPIPGSLEAIAQLNHHGYRVVVASNQSGVGRGLFNIDTLNRIHQAMRNELAEYNGHVDAIFFCPHHPEDACECRKPAPGLLRDVGERFSVSLQGICFVGDSYPDVQAAKAVEAQPILVKTGKGERTLAKYRSELRTVPVFDDLAAVVEWLLK